VCAHLGLTPQLCINLAAIKFKEKAKNPLFITERNLLNWLKQALTSCFTNASQTELGNITDAVPVPTIALGADTTLTAKFVMHDYARH